jgi:hypothetical protein
MQFSLLYSLVIPPDGEQFVRCVRPAPGKSLWVQKIVHRAHEKSPETAISCGLCIKARAKTDWPINFNELGFLRRTTFQKASPQRDKTGISATRQIRIFATPSPRIPLKPPKLLAFRRLLVRAILNNCKFKHLSLGENRRL